MSDLIERLLELKAFAPNDCRTVIDEAAAEIARLRGVLEDIRDHAISNGEDCAYLDAKAALESQ